MSRPLELVELRLHVAKYLDIDSLRACAVVCKEWHQDFQPQIWQYYSVKIPENNEYMEQCLESIRLNINWIQNLRSTKDLSEYSKAPELYDLLTAQCRSLVSLHMQIDDEVQLGRCLILLEQNKATLQRVNVRFRPQRWPPSKDHQIAGALLALTSLRELELYFTALSIGTIMDILNANSWVQSIQLKFYTPQVLTSQAIETLDNSPLLCEDMPAVRLKQFALEGVCHDPTLVALLKRCPQLERLFLNSLSEDVLEAICQLFRDRHFSRLKNLGLDAASKELCIPKIVHAVPPHQLTTIYLWFPKISTVRHLVQSQHQTLEDIKLDIDRGEGSSLGDILFGCSRLKRLYFTVEQGGVEIRSVIGQPWVCTQLEKLEVAFVLDNECTDTNLLEIASAEKEYLAPGRKECEQAMIVFMARFGQLKQLRYIDFHPGHYIFYSPPTPLPWSMSNGLDRLAEFSRLETIRLCKKYELPFGIPELQFIKQHWTSLKVVRCGVISSVEIREWLKDEWPELKILFSSATGFI
ncbi:hypothetical protein BGW41_003458 [Actinomortierella wolfii]|nr:hypothetical protein BGW41_003458 [Actinomortierella wolfii]